MSLRRSVSSLAVSFQNGFVTSEIARKGKAKETGNTTPDKRVVMTKFALPSLESLEERLRIAEVRNTKASG